MKNKQFFVMLILSFAFLPTAGFVNAQEEVGIIIQNAPVPELLEMDESVAPQDLGVGEPTILPDNPFYFFKNTFRGLRSTFTFNSERKAELKLRFANEKIIEAGKLAEKGNFKALERHLESYEKDIKSAGAKAKPEKFFEDNFKHQLLLGKFEKEAPVETAAGIKEVRAKSMEQLGLVIQNFSPERVGLIIQNRVPEVGSLFKPLRNLEVLKALEEKVPEQVKGAIRLAQENSLKRFKNDFERMTDEERKPLGEYIEKAGGDEAMYIKVFDQIKFSEIKNDVQGEIIEAREKLLTRFEDRIKEAANKDPELANKLLKPLTKGSIDDLKVIKELEYNIDPAFAKPVLQAKREALNRFRENIERADSPELFEEFADKVNERFVDVKHFDIFDDVKEVLPEEKQKFADDLKARAAEKMKEYLGEAKSASVREIKMRALVGEHPDYIGVIRGANNTMGSNLTEELLSKQVNRIEERVSHIEDPARLKVFEDRLQESDIKPTIQRLRPKVLEEVRVKAEEKVKDVKEKEANAMIEKAGNYLKDLRERADKVSREIREKHQRIIEETFQLTENHLAKAKQAFEQKDFGEAFGQATSALNLLRKIETLLSLPSAVAPIAPVERKVEQKPINIEIRPLPESPAEKPIEIKKESAPEVKTETLETIKEKLAPRIEEIPRVE